MARKRAAPTEPAWTPLQQEVLKGLQASIDPPRTTTSYKLGMLAVAFLNLLLPLLYLGLIFLVAHAMYWNSLYIKPTSKGAVFVFIGIYVMGIITLIFLIKPLFSRDPEASSPLVLKRSAEPFLFEYVDAVCDSVNARYPDSIRLVCEPNASAGFSGGLMGLLTGRMQLTIGLTLVQGMSVRQLSGVIAHEFGHFSQGSGMRVTYVVRMINAWLYKIVFLRDAWDSKLEEWSRGGDARVWIIIVAARGCVWMSRRILFGLLWVGNAISCYLLRQMEFDADRYEARLTGHRTFAATCRRLSELNIAHQMALSDLSYFHSEGRLADDLPALVVSNVERISPDFRKKCRRLELQRQTGLFDTHPADRERIENARDESAVGIFRISGEESDPPATILFSQLDRVCRAMTSDFYESVLGKHFKKQLLYPVRELIERRNAEVVAGKALDRYFQIHIPVDRPLPLFEDSDKAPASPREAALGLKEARDTVLKELAGYRDLPDRYVAAEQVMLRSAEALSVIECGLSIRGKEYGLSDNREKTAEAKHKRAKSAVQILAAKMLIFETAASERLSAALQLLQVPKVAAKIPNGTELQEEIRNRIRDARLISGIISGLPTLRILYRRTAILCSQLNNRENRRLINKIVSQLEGMHSRLRSIYDDLKDVHYPFDHANDEMTLQDFVIPYVPEQYDIGGLVNAADRVFDRLYTLQVRLFARLAQAAEQVETVLGLQMLPDYVAPVKSS